MALPRQARFFAAVLSYGFAAGALGGCINFLLPMLMSRTNIFTAMGVSLAASTDTSELYQRIVWGGVFGFLLIFRIPGLHSTVRNSFLLQALVYGLVPTLVQLFIIFPLQSDDKGVPGVAGLGLGPATPAVVFFINTAGWSLPALWWFKLLGATNEDDYDFDYSQFDNPLLV